MVQGDIVQLGQWGGYGGKPWEWTGSIRKIVLRHGAVVDSLTFTNIKDGKTETSPRFGGDRGERSSDVSLSDDEYLVTINGTVGVFPVYYPDQQLITSLTFVSNKRSYGPYGDGGGTRFSLPLEGRIAGFFGRCGEYLDAIGVNAVSSQSQLGSAVGGKIKVGLWGGPGGRSWQYDGPIEKITLKYGDVIDSISFGSTKFGGNGGGNTQEVSITGEEYLVSIRGTTANFNGNSVISSLVFVSNKRSYGPFPYGRQGATGHFYLPVQSGKITGFYGRSGDQLDAIGIIMAPLPPTLPNLTPPDQLGGEVHVVGAWGGEGGQPFKWDGPTHKIIVKFGTIIDSITFGYNNNWYNKVGGAGGSRSEEIPIKGSDEYVLEVRGTTGLYNYPTPIVKSLTFVTNKRTYGPYGTDSGDRFSYSVKDGYILGFHGRYGQYVDAIGFSVVSAGLPDFVSPI